jgi:hypothetical protein
VAPLTLSFDAKSALDRAKTNQDALGSELDVGDSEFTAIHAENFMSGNQSLFDVYVQISKGKYLKLLQAGDVFTIDRLETYLKKGILYFYIKKEVQESYLKYCDHLTTTILKSAATPTALKLSQTLNHGQQTLEFLKNSGLSESSILYARKFVTNVREMVSSIKVDADDPIASLIADVASYDHSVGTAALGGLLAKALEINMDKPTQIVGMALPRHRTRPDAGGPGKRRRLHDDRGAEETFLHPPHERGRAPEGAS